MATTRGEWAPRPPQWGVAPLAPNRLERSARRMAIRWRVRRLLALARIIFGGSVRRYAATWAAQRRYAAKVALAAPREAALSATRLSACGRDPAT